jgi:hypothetical protein
LPEDGGRVQSQNDDLNKKSGDGEYPKQSIAINVV